MIHPSSGHEKRRALEVSVSVSSLEFSLELSSSLSCLGTVSLRLDFTGAKLAVTPSLFMSVKYGTFEFSETFSLSQGVYFPLPILYALQTHNPLLSYCTFEIEPTPSSLMFKEAGAFGGPHEVTLTEDIPPADRMASFISSDVSMLFPEFM